jgi:hypothetical protein
MPLYQHNPFRKGGFVVPDLRKVLRTFRTKLKVNIIVFPSLKIIRSGRLVPAPGKGLRLPENLISCIKPLPYSRKLIFADIFHTILLLIFRKLPSITLRRTADHTSSGVGSPQRSCIVLP